MESIIGDYSSFLDRILNELDHLNLDVSKFEIDHLCYRVTTLEDYEKKKSDLSHYGTLLSEALIQGRPISTFKFHQPLKYKQRQIPLIEIPAPRLKKIYDEGLEHCEFVTSDDLSELVKCYPHIPFNTHMINDEFNPDISLKLSKGSVKFHPTSLAEVIKNERAP